MMKDLLEDEEYLCRLVQRVSTVMLFNPLQYTIVVTQSVFQTIFFLHEV